MRDASGGVRRTRRLWTPRAEALEGRALLTSAAFRVVSDWGSGFTGEVRIENTEAAPIAGWRLEFDFAPAIGPIWNGLVVSKVGSRYVVAGASWNRDIPPGGAVTFGFNASPGRPAGGPTGYALNGVPIGGPAPAPAPPTLAIDDVAIVEGNPASDGPGGFFRTEGNQIVDAAGNPVRLAGVNWFGLETPNFAPHGLWARGYRSMMDQMKQLGFNTIRLPYSSQLLDPGSVPNGIDFSKNPDLAGLNGLQIMDRIVDYAGRIGLRILLDHHRSTAGNSAQESGLWYTPAYPESRWIADWAMLAARYRGNPAVIGADLHNEPHGPATWGSGDPATDWRLAAERAGNAILAANPDWLIVVEGVERVGSGSTWWGGNLSAAGQAPVRLDVPGRLVYSPHDYPQSVYNQPWFSAPDYPANLPGVWDRHWGYLFREGIAPVLLGEFGSRLATAVDRRWAETMIAYLKGDLDGDGTVDLGPGRQGASWMWWSWNPNSGDTGGILNDDWTTVRAEALDLLRPVQFPLAPPAGGGGAGARQAVFAVTLSKPGATPVTVAYATADGTARAGSDYAPAAGTLTFAPGETRKTVAVTILGDSAVEPDETFSVRLSAPSGATLADAEGLGTILNDDIGPVPAPPPTARILGAAVAEGDSGSRPMTFTVELSAASAAPVTVDYATADGTARAGSDYLAAAGRLTFAPGETRKALTVSILGDTAVEPDEAFTVRLTAASGATLGAASATGTIRNDDAPPPPPPPPPPPTGGPVRYAVRSDWGDGFVADLTLANLGAVAWDGWELSFDLAATITNIWNAEIVRRVGDRYTIRAAPWNRAVGPGGTIGLGFQASASRTASRKPANVVLNGVSIP